jgi:hypothetical protein
MASAAPAPGARGAAPKGCHPAQHGSAANGAGRAGRRPWCALSHRPQAEDPSRRQPGAGGISWTGRVMRMERAHLNNARVLSGQRSAGPGQGRVPLSLGRCGGCPRSKGVCRRPRLRPGERLFPPNQPNRTKVELMLPYRWASKPEPTAFVGRMAQLCPGPWPKGCAPQRFGVLNVRL